MRLQRNGASRRIERTGRLVTHVDADAPCLPHDEPAGELLDQPPTDSEATMVRNDVDLLELAGAGETFGKMSRYVTDWFAPRPRDPHLPRRKRHVRMVLTAEIAAHSLGRVCPRLPRLRKTCDRRHFAEVDFANLDSGHFPEKQMACVGLTFRCAAAALIECRWAAVRYRKLQKSTAAHLLP